MNVYVTLALALNLVLAVATIGVGIWAIRRGDPRMWPLLGAKCGLGAVYVLGYIWVLRTGDDLAWSRLFRGVSLVAWPLAWMGESILHTKLFRHDVRRLKEELGS